jgi:hypothetical protein
MAEAETLERSTLPLDEADARILESLDALVQETHLLWDEEWVGFSWRNYTYEHMQRVRGLSRTMGRDEGADPRVIEFAATLHDVTKSYDGEIIVGPDGKRILDENGFWKNETLLPRRTNRVTELYDHLVLQGTLHNVSGGRIADALLGESGFEGDFRSRVDQAIREHLQAGDDASLEGRVLYDADTIDANIGLPAFYRNIQISLRGQDRQYARRGEDFVEWLRAHLPEYLDGYLRERIPTWLEGKDRDFLPKMTTAAGRRVAASRIERLRQINTELIAELEALEEALDEGRLAVVCYFMENRRNPRLTEQLAILEQRWAAAPGTVVDGARPGANRAPSATELLRHLRAEMAGEL